MEYSKSGISANHPTFIAIRDKIIELVKHYASLSRRWEGQWEDEVFQYKTGNINETKLDDVSSNSKLYLPTLPQSKPHYAETIIASNRVISITKTMDNWTI